MLSLRETILLEFHVKQEMFEAKEKKKIHHHHQIEKL
jgi:hypothetical protein